MPEPVPESEGSATSSGPSRNSSTRLVVDQSTFVVDEQTRVFREGVEIGYGALAVGDLVLVKAKLNSRGELVAREIKLRVSNAPDVKLTGHVERLDPPDLVASGRLVHTNSATAFLGLGDLVPSRTSRWATR